MKKTLLFLGIALSSQFISAQTQNLGSPISFKSKVLTTKKTYSLPEINNSERFNFYKNEAEQSKLKMLQYGEPVSISINLFEQAEKQVLPNGKNLYQLKINSLNAVSLNVVFGDFYLANGTILYIFNEDKTKYVGAYTSLNNNLQNVLGTELIYDDNIVIEIQEPIENENQSRLSISTVVHGFISLDDQIKDLNDSGDCNIDVNCPQGSGWELQRNGVVMLVNGTGGFCTGSMVNNTAGTNTPYFLTANHCGNDPGNWIYRFRWETPEAQADCGTNAPSANGPETMNINGGILRAKNASSDFQLIELNSIPDQLWEVTYNGWDKSGDIPQSGAGIHHPSGDIKKIAISSEPYLTGSFAGSPQNHWQALWSDGVTEGGSSGSPLFNQYRRIVGQLHGGGSFCGSSDMSDFYGKFSESWIGGGTPATRLSDWLDPNDTGLEFIDGNVTNSLDPFFTSSIIGASGTLCSGDLTPKVVITNGGSVAMTTATITYSVDGVEETFEWTGSLGLFESDTITLPNLNLTGGNHTITIVVSNPNGTLDENPDNNTISSSFNVIIGGETINIEFNLDCYADEISWEIQDDNNDVVFSGGDYANTGENYTVNESLCLVQGCYDLIVFDSYGDGMSSNQCDPGSFHIFYGNDTLNSLFDVDADFGTSITKSFCFPDTTNSNSILEKSISNLNVFPNPFVTKFFVKDDVMIKQIIIHDITGKIVFEENDLESNSVEINPNLKSGIYYLTIVDLNGENYIKIIK